MMRGLLTISTFVSVLLLPWPFTMMLALATASVEPLVPLAAGLFADAVYYIPATTPLPYATLAGAIITAFAFFVRRQLVTGIMDR